MPLSRDKCSFLLLILLFEKNNKKFESRYRHEMNRALGHLSAHIG